ncbi:thioester reductase [Nocardioides sp. W3-2-3]|uniref:condensation domain-containing protein n=1 Tax=Nocardioides convexus TaxID=2712224 RepID=UPI00241865F6|nr:condensation domain-containing protein [Nocardioides convexus]NHA00369.1 thioester reductase [Nocardioides convexus]
MQRVVGVPFEPIDSALSRILVVRRDEQRHLFAFAVDHIINDQISGALLEQTLATYYRRHLAGAPVDVTAPHTYAAFAARQQAAFAGLWGEQCRAYWERHVADHGLYPPTLAEDGPRTGTPVLASLRRDLPADAQARVHAFALATRTTPFTVTTASVLSALLEITGDRSVGVTVNHHGRMLPGTAETLGLFVQTVPIHLRAADHSPAATAREVLGASLDAFERFVPLRVAGRAWGIDLVAPDRDAGIYVSHGEEVPADAVLQPFEGTTSVHPEFRVPGGKQWTDTVAIDWHLTARGPQIGAHFNADTFSESACGSAAGRRGEGGAGGPVLSAVAHSGACSKSRAS